jgi:hypothetical protein
LFVQSLLRNEPLLVKGGVGRVVPVELGAILVVDGETPFLHNLRSISVAQSVVEVASVVHVVSLLGIGMRRGHGSTNIVVVIENDVTIRGKVRFRIAGAPQLVHELDVEALVCRDIERVFRVAHCRQSLRIVLLGQRIFLLLRHTTFVTRCLWLIDNFDDADCGFVGWRIVNATCHPVKPLCRAVIIALREEAWQPFLSETLHHGQRQSSNYVNDAYLSRESIADLLRARRTVEIDDNEHAEVSRLLNDSVEILQVHVGKVLAAVNDTS